MTSVSPFTRVGRWASSVRAGCGKTTVGRTLLRLTPATAGQVKYRDEDFSPSAARTAPPAPPHADHLPGPGQQPEPAHDRRQHHRRADSRSTASRKRQANAPTWLPACWPARRPRPQLRRSATPTSFPAASGSASASRGRWPCRPTSSSATSPSARLDVSIQSQILNLLADLQQERNIAYLFIAHNLAVVEHFSHDVGGDVPRAHRREGAERSPVPVAEAPLLGRTAQRGPRARPQTQTQAHRPHRRGAKPANPPTGCAFHPRCPLTRDAAKNAEAKDTTEITTGA